jgi:putative transposase
MNHARDPLYRRHRFPAEVIGYAVWLYFRFPLSLRMVEEMLAARGIIVSHETIRCWAEKFGREFSKRIRRCAPVRGDKWHLDEGHRQVNLSADAKRRFSGYRRLYAPS